MRRTFIGNGVGRGSYRLRVVAAAAGAVASLALAAVTFFTGIGLVVGLVGAPVGATVGALVGPRVVRSTNPGGVVLLAALLAIPVGSVGFATATAIGEGHGASAGDLVAYVSYWSLGPFGVIGAMVGGPMALLGAALASWWLRHTTHPERRWAPAAAVVLLVGGFTVLGFISAAQRGGDEAARIGDRVTFEYVVRDTGDGDYSDHGYLLEVRTFWHGDTVEGTGSGSIDICQRGTDTLQGSDWEIWIGSDRDVGWVDRSVDPPLVSSASFGTGVPVRLTIIIAPDGTASWDRGVDRRAC